MEWHCKQTHWLWSLQERAWAKETAWHRALSLDTQRLPVCLSISLVNSFSGSEARWMRGASLMSGGRSGGMSYPRARAGLMEAGDSDICFQGWPREGPSDSSRFMKNHKFSTRQLRRSQKERDGTGREGERSHCESNMTADSDSWGTSTSVCSQSCDPLTQRIQVSGHLGVQ